MNDTINERYRHLIHRYLYELNDGTTVEVCDYAFNDSLCKVKEILNGRKIRCVQFENGERVGLRELIATEPLSKDWFEQIFERADRQ